MACTQGKECVNVVVFNVASRQKTLPKAGLEKQKHLGFDTCGHLPAKIRHDIGAKTRSLLSPKTSTSS